MSLETKVLAACVEVRRRAISKIRTARRADTPAAAAGSLVLRAMVERDAADHIAAAVARHRSAKRNATLRGGAR